MMYPTQIGETCLIILLSQLLNVTHALHRRSAKDATLRVSQTRGFNQPERAARKVDSRQFRTLMHHIARGKNSHTQNDFHLLKLHTACRIP
jgi:hypothetical protein